MQYIYLCLQTRDISSIVCIYLHDLKLHVLVLTYRVNARGQACQASSGISESSVLQWKLRATGYQRNQPITNDYSTYGLSFF